MSAEKLALKKVLEERSYKKFTGKKEFRLWQEGFDQPIDFQTVIQTPEMEQELLDSADNGYKRGRVRRLIKEVREGKAIAELTDFVLFVCRYLALTRDAEKTWNWSEAVFDITHHGGRSINNRSVVQKLCVELNKQGWLDDLSISWEAGKISSAGDEKAEENEDNKPAHRDIGIDLNTILYGPPGTGKTYHTRCYAVAIAEERTLEEVWAKYNNSYREISAAYQQLEDEGRVSMVTFHQSYGYEEFIQGIRPVMEEGKDGEEKADGQLRYRVEDGVFTRFCRQADEDEENSYVFIIDEINRGNIAKIFGELITLIESSKRKRFGEDALGSEQARVRLPYDDEEAELFSVPENVYLLGTMNTADRSLALLDTALRRRFDFVEMMPSAEALRGVVVSDGTRSVDVQTLLENLNLRLELLVDREHTIGHAFFLPLKDTPTPAMLGRIMRRKVLPLLQEFFYDDYELLQLVLGKKLVRRMDENPKYKAQRALMGSRQLPSSYELDLDALEDLGSYDYLLKGDQQSGEVGDEAQ